MMSGVGRKGNLGLGTMGERLTLLGGVAPWVPSSRRLQDQAEAGGGRSVWECTLRRAGEWWMCH